MSTSLVSDFFVPEVALEYARQAFVTSMDFFNQAFASGEGAVVSVVDPEALTEGGQFIQTPILKRISSLVSRRDLTSVAGITGLKLEGTQGRAALVNKKVGHVEYTPDAEWLSKLQPGQISQEVGQQAGEESASAIQSSVLNAISGAIDAVAASAHTHSVWAAAVRTNLSPSLLQAGRMLLGDFLSRIGLWVLRSESFSDLFLDAIGRSYDAVGGMALRGDPATNTLGKPFAMLDNAILTTADAGFDKYHTLGLGAGVAKVRIVRPLTFYPEVQYINTEQVTRHIRADFDYMVEIPNFAFDASTPNPTDANLADSTKWTPVYGSHKEFAAVKITHNYSGN